MYVETAYLTYLAISAAATVFVARALAQHGEVFLIASYSGDTAMARAVNRLLVMGFYLINAGYFMFQMRTGGAVPELRDALELLSQKLGMVFLVLGVMHLFNLYLFSRICGCAAERMEAPPLPHDSRLQGGPVR